MDRLRIFVDLAAPADVLDFLRAATKGHELVFPDTPGASVLATGGHHPEFGSVDVAFGQPGLGAIREARRLKWVEISTAGITRYDNPEFRALVRERNIVVSNTGSVYSEACAVHVLSFILAQARRVPIGLETRTGSGTPEWHALRNSCGTLRGETILILGYGGIGKWLIRLLVPFAMNVLAYRRKARGDEGVPILNRDQLPDALSRADHIVDLLPENAETRHFVDGERFAAMKRGAIFYNVGRGTTVNQEALLEALRSGRLRAAWLDVTEPEPLPEDHPLWGQPNCFITPHLAGGHPEEAKTLVDHFLENLGRFERGEPLLDRVM